MNLLNNLFLPLSAFNERLIELIRPDRFSDNWTGELGEKSDFVTLLFGDGFDRTHPHGRMRVAIENDESL